MSATVSPEQILKELAQLWADSGKQGQAEGGTGVLRACSMTLLVLAEASEDLQGLGETIAALMPEHPARTVVVRLSGAGERALSERVYSQCWMPFGQRRQVCCEQVEITASDAALPDLLPVVLPLAVPDLPLILWCRSARLLGMREFREIAAMAGKIVLDSAAAPDPAGALARAKAIAAGGAILGDLAWTRLTRWREMLSQLFENQRNLARLVKVSEVDVEWGGIHAASAWYLGAWIADSLVSVGVHPKLSIRRAANEEDTLRVRLTGDGVAAELGRQEDRMVVTLDGASQCTNLPQPTDYLLMREELGIVRRDAIFEKALDSAARLAGPTANGAEK
jgi:glucose-6-phosphate dehydrogenase assembly protein OpcA